MHRISRLPLVLLFILFLTSCASSPSVRDQMSNETSLQGSGRPGSSDLIVHVIDSGQGNCQLLQCGSGDPIMLDCGGGSGLRDGDAMKAIIKEYLANQLADYKNSSNVVEFEALVLSHPDKDHINYIREVLPLSSTDPDDTTYTFRKLVYSNKLSEYKANGMQDYLKTLIKNGTEVFTPSTNVSVYHSPLNVGQFAAEPFLKCINDNDQFVSLLSVNSSSERNPGSTVLRVQSNKYSVILPGDAEESTFEAIYKDYGVTAGGLDRTTLNTSVLISAHHGAETQNSNNGLWAFLTNPISTIFPAGINRSYGHPRCTSLNVFANNQIWRDEMGKEASSCGSNNACRNHFNTRSQYVARLVDTGVPHAVDCATDRKTWISESPSTSIFNLWNTGTIQIWMNTGDFYHFYCPDSSKPNEGGGALSCAYNRNGYSPIPIRD